MKKTFTRLLAAAFCTAIMLFNVQSIKAQNALTTFGISGTTAASAYSLRKLSTSYTGSAIQVRRSNDNNTSNIGFTANGDLDTATLKTFVGSNSAFVTIWYDQSGNARDLTQTTTSKQPAIISAGIIFRRNGRPTLFFDGTDDGMGFSGSNYLTTNPLTVNLVAGSNSNTVGFRRAVQGYNNWLIGPYNATHSWYAGGWNHQASPAWSTTVLENFTVIQPISANCTSFRNGTSVTSGSSKDVPNKLGLGTEGSFAEPLNGFISEVVSYPTDLSSTNRQLMENSQLAYYPPPISNNANLTNLFSWSIGSVSPSFEPNTTSYTFPNAPYTLNSMTVTPTASEANATIQVRINGGSYSAVASGAISSALNLSVGNNTIDIRVTAQDGTTTKTYTVGVQKKSNLLNNMGMSSQTINTPAAFSLRKLSTAYAGSAIQVRRSNDNTTQDIGFTANGDLDTTSLKTFVGNNNGFVSIWYDQSGYNRNASQATTALQPQIINAGVIYRKNRKPTVYFNNTFLATASFTNYSSAFELFIAAGVQNNTTFSTFGGKTTGTNAGPWDFWGSNFYYGNGSSYSYRLLSEGINAASGFSQWSFDASITGGRVYRNGALISSGSGTEYYGDVNNALYLGTRGDRVTSLNGWISEYVTLSTSLGFTEEKTTLINSQLSYFDFSNTNLSALTINGGSLSPNFITNTTTYNVSVNSSTTSITVTPTVEAAGATISVSVNGGANAALASGTQSGSLAVNPGANTVVVTVLAPNGITSKEYTINVTRELTRLTTFGITTANAESAYSLRKLSTDYSGFAIQVRRSSDNTTQNIGFTGTGDLDTTALKTFVGNNNGLVSIWYDQSGYSRDLTQTDTAKQPSIITAGIIYKKDFRPTLYLDAINDGMLYTGNAYFNPAFYSVNLVAGSNSNTVAPRRAVQGKYDSYYINFYNWLVGPYNNTHSWFAGGSVSGAFNHQIAQPWSTTKLERFTVIYNEAATYFSTSYRNNVGQNVFVSNTETSPGSLCIGASGAFAEPLDGFLSEVVSYNVGLNETNRLLMENNQAAYYEPLANANLNALSLSTGSLSPTFTANTTAYTATVNNTTTSINVTAIPDFVGATLSININAGAFTALTSGNPSNAIALNVGANTIDVKVVSSDGTINKTYTITVTRELPPLTTLANSTVAATAFSLRKLTTHYTGNAIQVRRSNDNTTTNIGFTANGDLDTTALKTFVGNNNGFVSIWYDQSGLARNATQSTNTAQPQIIDAGVIYRKNNVPTIYFNEKYLATQNYIAYNVGITTSTIAGVSAYTYSPTFGNKTNGNTASPLDVWWAYFHYGNGSSFNWFQMLKPIAAESGFSQWSFLASSNGASAFINKTDNGSSTAGSIYQDANTPLVLGSRQDLVTSLIGWISEHITFPSVLNTTDRQVVENNQMFYHGINNANLNNLMPSVGTLISPSFAVNTTAYNASVSNNTVSITVTPTVEAEGATVQVRVNGGSYVTVASGAASSALRLNVGSNTIDVLVTALDGTTTKTYTITVTRGPITWMGGTSTDFSNPANWSGGAVPTVVNDFVVASSANNPIITGTHAVNNFTINSGANLTVAGTLQIAGSITNSGTVTATSGTVELNGSTAQNIPANTFASNTVNNLTINNSAGVSLDGALTVTGVLTPTAGVLNTGGNLILASTATGTASIVAGSGTYITGNVTMQRYTRAQRGYRTLAHPYTTAQTVAQLTDNFQITGLTSGPLGTYGVSTGAPSALYYDGTKPVGTTSVLGRITSTTSTDWAVGKGLYVFIRGNGSEGTGGSYASSGGAPSPITLDVTSANINQGDVTVTLSPYTVGGDNYTLVGNPYPCPINLNGVTNIGDFGNVYIYNPTLSGGATTILRGGFEQQASKNIVIPSMGCFYIQSTASTPTTITFHESDKVAGGESSYSVFGIGAKDPKIGLEISTSAGFMDRTKIAFANNATSAATDFYDGSKLSNSLVTFYSLSSERKALGLDYRKTATTDIIPLGIQTATATNYTISLSELTDLPNTQVVLRDKLLKTETILSQVGDSYSFAITADTATKGENRFEIGLLGTTVLPVQIADITAQLQTNKTVAVNWTSTTEVNLASYKVQRSKDGSNFTTVGIVAANGASTYSYSDDLSSIISQLSTVVYYRLEAVDKDGSKTYSKVVSCQLSVVSTSMSIYPNPVQSTLYAQVTVTKAGAAQLRVVDAQGKVVATQKTQLAVGTTSISIPAAQLAQGSYTLEIDTMDGKQTQRFVKE